jgi:hypothetical protein
LRLAYSINWVTRKLFREVKSLKKSFFRLKPIDPAGVVEHPFEELFLSKIKIKDQKRFSADVKNGSKGKISDEGWQRQHSKHFEASCV